MGVISRIVHVTPGGVVKQSAVARLSSIRYTLIYTLADRLRPLQVNEYVRLSRPKNPAVDVYIKFLVVALNDAVPCSGHIVMARPVIEVRLHETNTSFASTSMLTVVPAMTPIVSLFAVCAPAFVIEQKNKHKHKRDNEIMFFFIDGLFNL
jgi:hypothetical protein